MHCEYSSAQLVHGSAHTQGEPVRCRMSPPRELLPLSLPLSPPHFHFLDHTKIESPDRDRTHAVQSNEVRHGTRAREGAGIRGSTTYLHAQSAPLRDTMDVTTAKSPRHIELCYRGCAFTAIAFLEGAAAATTAPSNAAITRSRRKRNVGVEVGGDGDDDGGGRSPPTSPPAIDDRCCCAGAA